MAIHARAACGDANQRHVRVDRPSHRLGVPVPVARPPVPTQEVTSQETKTPPARPLRGHLLCAGTALPVAGSARAPSSARLSSSSSKVRGDSKDLSAGAMAEGAQAALQRIVVSGAAHPAAPRTVPLVMPRPRPPTARHPQPATHSPALLTCPASSGALSPVPPCLGPRGHHPTLTAVHGTANKQRGRLGKTDGDPNARACAQADPTRGPP